jgi:hypothetical protein
MKTIPGCREKNSSPCDSQAAVSMKSFLKGKRIQWFIGRMKNSSTSWNRGSTLRLELSWDKPFLGQIYSNVYLKTYPAAGLHAYAADIPQTNRGNHLKKKPIIPPIMHVLNSTKSVRGMKPIVYYSCRNREFWITESRPIHHLIMKSVVTSCICLCIHSLMIIFAFLKSLFLIYSVPSRFSSIGADSLEQTRRPLGAHQSGFDSNEG